MIRLQITRSQINQPPPPSLKLLQPGCAPLLLTTRVIPACDVLISETGTIAESAIRDTLSGSAVTSPANSKTVLPTVKLLGKLRGGMPGEQYALPEECPKCRVMNSLRGREIHCPRCRLLPHLGALIKERKLSSETWEKIRRALCLPKEIKNLSPDRMRAVLRLLDLFVERFSFGEQEAITKESIRTTLIELPGGLPRPFSKLLMGILQRGAIGSNRKLKRKLVSVRRFAEVAARQGSFCFWCGIRVVRESEIPQTNRIAKNHSTIVYLSAGGELCEQAFATIDHLIRVTDGGSNKAENLVISCYPCNQLREVKNLFL